MDARTLRAYQWDKQNLRLPAPAGSHRRLLKSQLGLHSTDYLTPYLSLWARIRRFEPKTLFDDLNLSRNAVRVRAFRGTVFVVHRENLLLVLGGLRTYHDLIRTAIAKMARKSGQDLTALEKRVIVLLRGKKRLPASALNRDLRSAAPAGVSPFFLRYLEFGRVLVRVGQEHAEDKTMPYGLLREWFPEAGLSERGPDDLRDDLALAYLRAFGPACLDDLCWWMPLPKTEGRAMLQRLKNRLASFDFGGREYFLAGEEWERFRKFEPDGDRPVVRFLPYEDHFPKAYARRDWFLPPEAAKFLIGARTIEMGQIRPSIWLDGEVIGRWEVDRPRNGRATPARVRVVELVKAVKGSKRILAAVNERRAEVEDFLAGRLLPLCGSKEEI